MSAWPPMALGTSRQNQLGRILATSKRAEIGACDVLSGGADGYSTDEASTDQEN